MKRWWRDTLARRLFVLMWVALVASHMAAYWVVTGLGWLGPPPASESGRGALAPPRLLPPDAQADLATEPDRQRQPPGQPGHPPPRPTFPSLPPTPGVPQISPAEGHPAKPPPLPTPVLLLDYGVRLLVIGLAAWIGARWLARPVQRLVAAARVLGQGLHSGQALPELDTRHGTVEVTEAARVFNAMAGQLQSQFRSRNLLMAAVSHDLRTPLTRLRMRLEKMEPSDGVARCVADIQEMDTLIGTSLQTFRALEASEMAQPTDLPTLLQSLVDDLAESGQVVALVLAPCIAPVQPLAMRRAIDNLVQNALRHGGAARVTLWAGAPCRITVDDDGPGIPEDRLSAVFEPFYRLDAARGGRAVPGSGLGLYIARELLARQGWRLRLINRPEGGLRAELTAQG